MRCWTRRKDPSDEDSITHGACVCVGGREVTPSSSFVLLLHFLFSK